MRSIHAPLLVFLVSSVFAGMRVAVPPLPPPMIECREQSNLPVGVGRKAPAKKRNKFHAKRRCR